MGCVLTFILASNLATGADLPSWKLGNSWHVELEMSPIDKDGNGLPAEKPLTKYDMHVLILGPDAAAGPNVCKVDFLIHKKPSPGGITYRQRLIVELKTGWPIKAFSFRDYKPMPIRNFGEVRFLIGAPQGYPLEILPPAEDFEAAVGRSKLTFTTEAEGTVRRAILWDGDVKDIEIRQVWKKGASWWSEYERYRKGKLDLRGRLVEPVKTATLKPAPKPAPPEPAKTKSTYPPFVDETHDPLPKDPELQAIVTWRASNPRVQDVLAFLGKHTKRSLTMKDVDEATPVFGTVTFNLTVAMVMKDLARTAPVRGRWEKTETGYCLVGTHTTNVADAANVATEPNAARAEPDPFRSQLLIAVVLVGVALGLVCLFRHWQLRRAKAE